MAWTFPKTWSAGELVTADLLNTHLRDNLNALHAKPKAYFVGNSVNYTTSSSSFVNVDSNNLVLSIDTTGGDVLVVVMATLSITGTSWTDRVNLVVGCDGVLGLPRLLISRLGNDNNKINACFYAVFPNLSIDTHDFNLQWLVAGGTSALMSQVTMLVWEIG